MENFYVVLIAEIEPVTITSSSNSKQEKVAGRAAYCSSLQTEKLYQGLSEKEEIISLCRLFEEADAKALVKFFYTHFDDGAGGESRWLTDQDVERFDDLMKAKHKTSFSTFLKWLFTEPKSLTLINLRLKLSRVVFSLKMLL